MTPPAPSSQDRLSSSGVGLRTAALTRVAHVSLIVCFTSSSQAHTLPTNKFSVPQAGVQGALHITRLSFSSVRAAA